MLSGARCMPLTNVCGTARTGTQPRPRLQLVREPDPMALLEAAPVEPRRTAGSQRSWPRETISGWQDDLAFQGLRAAYRASGGIARGDVVDRLCAVRGRTTFIRVAELLANEDLFGWEWDNSLWVPMFQFEPSDMSLRPAPRRVRAVLGHAFDGWGVSTWFVEPHESLARHRPVDLLESNLRAILQAARADHAVGAG